MSTLKIKRENGKIFCPLADSWHIETPEEKVRQEYIKILVEDYGYSLDQMAQEIKVNNSQRGQGKARADIVIWKSKQDKIESKAAFIVVECKAENVRIREEDYYQGYNYASWAGASFFVTTNEKETKYFCNHKSTRHFPACSHNFPKAGEARFQGRSRLFRLLGKLPYLGESRRILMAVSSKTSSKTRFCYAATRRISSAAVQPSIWA